jgi:hypothetical protein
VFGATVYETTPFPLPDTPAVIWIHEALLIDTHAQVSGAETLIVPDPPVAPTL